MPHVNCLQAQLQGTEEKKAKSNLTGLVPNTDEEKNALSFKWKGIDLGSTLLEIKKTHPGLVADSSWLPAIEKKQGISGLALRDEPGIDMALVRTYKDKAYYVIIVYDYDDVAALAGGDFSGGLKLLLGKLRSKLGGGDFSSNDEKKKYQVEWVFKKVNRSISIEFHDKERYARLLYIDETVQKHLTEEATKKADVGF
jgi:hypothetical protein